MNPVGWLSAGAKRLAALRTHRRDRRVERIGGHPGTRPQVAVISFTPQLGMAERTREMTAEITRLGPEGVDEATGDLADNLLSLQGIDYRHQLDQQYHAYLPEATAQLSLAHAAVQEYQYLHDSDLARLSHAETALEAAILGLSGDGSAGLVNPVSPKSGSNWPTPPGAEGGRAADPAPGVDIAARDVTKALALPRPRRDELRPLLIPSDRKRVPDWEAPGFADGALLAGRPWGAFIHILALLLAAGADIGAFAQVIELVLTQQSDLTIYLVVAGFTAVVLYTAHTIGVLLREVKAGAAAANRLGPTAPPESRRWAKGGAAVSRLGRRLWSRTGRRLSALVCIAVWAALGLLAYWIRLTVPPLKTPTLGDNGAGVGGGASSASGIGGGGIGGGGIGGGSSSTGVNGDYTHQSALLFLGLYVGTGLVAALGAYFTHNPYRGRYARALSAVRRASEQAAASAHQLGQAQAHYLRQQAEINAAGQILVSAKEQSWALAAKLKEQARFQIAGMAKDPAVTDAVFQPDHNPYWPTTDAADAGGQNP